MNGARPQQAKPNGSDRPTALEPQFQGIPSELRALPNWIMWRYEPPDRPDNPKWKKVPCSLNGNRTDATKRTPHWTTFDACREAYLRGIAGTGPRFDGIGFCFDGEIGPDGYCYTGIDFDNLGDGNTINLQQRARILRLKTYTEKSPGGRGLHCICRSKPHTLKKNGIEIYSRARYFTFTGLGCKAIRVADAEVAAIAAEVQAEQGAGGKAARASGANGQRPQRIEAAEAFRHLDPHHDLNEGIEQHWFDRLQPLQKDAAVDLSLATIASNTKLLELEENGGNNDQWYRITTAVARSGAPNAEDIFVKYAAAAKDADPEDALREHFARCQNEHPRGLDDVSVGTLLWLAQQHGADFEQWRNSAAEQERRARQVAENIEIGDDVTEPLLPQVMTLAEMRRRLVFIGSTGGVADTETGRVRKKEHAADEYAASTHTYTQKNATGKEVVKVGPALKLWIASKDRVTVEFLAWVPGAAEICQPPEGRGPAFNMWRGLPPMAYPDDWQERVIPFLEHIEFLVPIAGERERFLQWLAHIVQHPEVLPHTSYLMITPVTGIGRNLMASILVRVLRGFVAAGVSLPELLDHGFTGRLGEKLLVIVDEAREGSGEKRYQRAERLKSLITEEHRRINPKYGHESIQKNCARWLMFSQHHDAIPFDTSDRRVIAIENPTNRKPAVYYERLYGMLNDQDFIGSVRHYLETKDIDAFRPGEHAPMNEAKVRVLDEMMSETERSVAEFKEDCETELTSQDAIKDHVVRNNKHLPVNDTHLTFAIRRARMVNTGRRITAYRKNTSFGTINDHRFSVVIVRGEWTAEVVKNADAQKLLRAMGLQDWSAVKPKR